MHQLRLSSSKQSSVGAKDNSKAEERARRAWCMGDNACQGAAGGGQGLSGIQHWAPEGEKVNLSKLQRFYLKLCSEVQSQPQGKVRCSYGDLYIHHQLVCRPYGLLQKTQSA